MVERLEHYTSYPTAAEALHTAVKTDPLDGSEARHTLQQYRALFCDRSVREFRLQDIESASHVKLYSGIHPVSHRPVVLKEYHLDNDAQLNSVRRELSVFSRVQAPNIVQCLGFMVEDNLCHVILERFVVVVTYNVFVSTFQIEKTLVLSTNSALVDTRYSCDLASYIESFNPSVEVKRHIMHEVLLGLVSLDTCHIVHKDIKPQNILINHEEDGTVTGVALTDFDISKSEDDFIATIRQAQTRGLGTTAYIDVHHSVPTLHHNDNPTESPKRQFDHLSDIYSMGKVVVWLYDGDNLINADPDFSTDDLSSVEVSIIKTCFGPKAERSSAYALLNKGLFARDLTPSAPSASAELKYRQLLQELWTGLQIEKDTAPEVACSVEALLVHCALPEEPSLGGYTQLMPVAADDTEQEAETSVLRMILRQLCQPISIGEHQVTILDPLCDAEFPVCPTLYACSLMQEAREQGDLETVATYASYYACLGRLTALFCIENPLEHGLFGKLVLAGLHSNPNRILRNKSLVSHLFAATFPQQRKNLITLIENPGEVDFSSIPGCKRDELVTRDNVDMFASEFETGYVRLVLEAVVEMRRGFNSIHPDWASTLDALTLSQFIHLSVGFPPFTADEYLRCFQIDHPELEAAFRVFVEEQVLRQDLTILRRLLMFAIHSIVLPQQQIVLEVEDTHERLGLPTAHACTRTVSIPSCCIGRPGQLEVAFRDAFDNEGITLGTGDRRIGAVEAAVNEELNRFRILPGGRRTCPHCGVAVEKLTGCNHMTCLCGRHWCWVCGFESQEMGAVYAHMEEVHGGVYEE
ncbi:hypothetical protein KIPB_003050 [Kipferlia bialata]|uniref:Protein kinase domain-containing protein n=1 Tax=Kipferlia bialata TaxID=797122 RepID=A0A9K3CRX9_9EUKA|nr:hypothetical protein KIPB_003050 [Kipferlia bialata]|eukprot:g3050.t1